jgi:hypothetical protein
MTEKLHICMFANVCANSKRCTHAHPHFVSHTRNQNCNDEYYICCDYICNFDDYTLYEYKGKISKINPFNVQYPRCIDYKYWLNAVNNGAYIVLKDYSLGRVDGSTTRHLRDGYRSNDWLNHRKIHKQFQFLNPKKEEPQQQAAPRWHRFDEFDLQRIEARVVNRRR